MKVDLSITISVILATCAIVVPLLTTILNNRHIRKMRKLELELEAKKQAYFYRRGIYEDYLKNTSRCISCGNAETYGNYGESYSLALLYFPKELIPELQSINLHIREAQYFSLVRNEFDNLAPKIRAILQKL